jgi:hypothetical protein
MKLSYTLRIDTTPTSDFSQATHWYPEAKNKNAWYERPDRSCQDQNDYHASKHEYGPNDENNNWGHGPNE